MERGPGGEVSQSALRYSLLTTLPAFWFPQYQLQDTPSCPCSLNLSTSGFGRSDEQTESGSESATVEKNISDWSQQRIALAGEMLLEYMLFRDEAPLKGPVKGTSTFASEFERRGLRDSKGRSLRQFDLQTRLFRYPCSFMIYSSAFDSLPLPMKNYLWGRLDQILTGKDKTATYSTLKAQERQALLEILRETNPEFAAWLRK